MPEIIPGVSRALYYDRNPKTIVDEYSQEGLGVSALITPSSYTVPAGRKGFIEMMRVRQRRVTVAAPAGRAYMRIRLTKSGAAAVTILESCLTSNVVDAETVRDVGTSIAMLAGDLIDIQFGDTSTGGTIDKSAAWVLHEFDA